MRSVPFALTTLGASLLVSVVLHTVGRWISRSDSPRARRSGAILQLSRWGVVLLGVAVAGGSVLLRAGIPSNLLAIFAGAIATGIALTLREPFADFIAAASLLAERTVGLGDEVSVNEDVTGRVVSFGLRGIMVETWDGSQVYVIASTIKTLRNMSVGPSRATVDIAVPSHIPVARAHAVIERGCARARDVSFRSDPVVLGVVNQGLEHNVFRVSCLVSPAGHWAAGYKLRAAAADAVTELRRDEQAGVDPRATAEILKIVDGIRTSPSLPAPRTA